jgi:MFS family permease
VDSDTFENTPQVWAGIIAVLWIKVIAGVFAFPICAILITQSSPSRELLGSVNGANQALGSLCRAIGPAIAGTMYSHSLELGKPWIVWRYGLAIFAAVVWVGSWFLSDEVRLPNAKEYRPVADEERDDAIEEEEERLRREEEDGTVDMERALPPLRNQKDTKSRSSDGRGGDQDDSDGSSDDDMVNGVSRHLLSREH